MKYNFSVQLGETQATDNGLNIGACRVEGSYEANVEEMKVALTSIKELKAQFDATYGPELKQILGVVAQEMATWSKSARSQMMGTSYQNPDQGIGGSKY